MITKKSLIVSVTVSIVCVILGIVCAFIRSFDWVSIAMLAAVVILSVIIIIFSWKEIINIKKQ